MKKLPENARILVVKFNAIGDVVMMTPAIRDLRTAYPAAHIALLVGSWSAPVIRNNPHLDEIIEFDQGIFLRRRWRDIFRLLLEVRRRRYDAAVILHAMLPVHFFLWLARIPLRYGMARKGRGFFLTAAVSEALEPDRYYARKYQEVSSLAGAPVGSSDPELHVPAADEMEARRLLAEKGLVAGEEFLLVAPGGGRNPRSEMQAKRWPKERFAEVIADLLKDRPRLRIVLTGAESDREETSYLARVFSGVVDLTGKITLPELSALARAARAVLCNDSSALHIAVAVGTPVVAPFGPTDARQLTVPWALAYVRQSTVACSPCYRVGSGTSFAGCPIGFQCMQEAGTAQIRPLLDRALAHPRT